MILGNTVTANVVHSHSAEDISGVIKKSDIIISKTDLEEGAELESGKFYLVVEIPDQTYTLTLPAGRMRGDVNGDGEVDVTDSDLIRAHSINVSILTDPIQLWCADCNNSGTINVTDAFQASQVGGGTRLLGSLGNDYTGNYIVNPNYETEAGQFYTDIAVSDLPNSNNITVLDNAGLVTKAECNNGFIRVYVSKCPITDTTIEII